MSTASQILFGAAALFVFWQVVLVVTAIVIVHAGRYRRVNISVVPGLIAFMLFMTAIFLE